MATAHIDRTAGIDEIAAEMDRRGEVIEKLEREKAEAMAYLKAFVFATIDPSDRRANVQVHQANPSLGWYFTVNDTGLRGQREILGGQIRRAMEIVGFDKLKIEPASTTLADDHVAAVRCAAETEAKLSSQIERLEQNLMACARGAFFAGYSEGVSKGIAVCSGGDDSLDIEASWENSLSRQTARLGIADAKAVRS